MRARFSDTFRLKRLAKKNLETGLARLKRWWIRKYNLPPNHELFQKQSIAELNLEEFEDAYARREEILEELESPDLEMERRGQLFDVLNKLNKFLDLPEEIQDELIDKWERELAEGKVPDLNEKV